MKQLYTLLLILSSFYLQAQSIAGKVSDANTGEPVAGASVNLLDTDNGTRTDADGTFTLDGTGPIQVSHVGYRTLKLKSGDRLTIELMPETTALQTVEVVGRCHIITNSDRKRINQVFTVDVEGFEEVRQIVEQGTQ